MLSLINQTQLPSKPEYAGLGSTFGIDLDLLRDWQTEWLTTYDWNQDEAYINKFHHFTTTIEDLDIHFIHHQSPCPDAIPIILLHGWPGPFLEFLPVIEELAGPKQDVCGNGTSFHVVVPSLPGFAFSSIPPENWLIDDTARVFNTLMADVLVYQTFAVHGTDWGSSVGFSLYSNFNQTVRADHMSFLPFFALLPEELVARNISLESPLEQAEEDITVAWLSQGQSDGSAYYYEHTTRAKTIGLALQDNPVGQLAWMGEKFVNWSDPRAGTGPSVLNSTEILRSVSLYFLTESFTSSIFIYAQSPNGFTREYYKAQTDAPFLFSAFKYNFFFFPAALVKEYTNLTSYKNHDFGGHFPGLDNPAALVEDIRDIGNFWYDN
ncbi:hypothetical protein Daus18300_003943 [Diaporthe australafricana]|uniref:Epoxide hydrolase N-terminal domain-containing protein n=1 Tax=Diaporthe australafricana TaxID=127596 RepID=A0ABR3XC94_9PEZI